MVARSARKELEALTHELVETVGKVQAAAGFRILLVLE
jgi:hypothetical protein